jgi:dienelactone hydrolase
MRYRLGEAKNELMRIGRATHAFALAKFKICPGAGHGFFAEAGKVIARTHKMPRWAMQAWFKKYHVLD